MHKVKTGSMVKFGYNGKIFERLYVPLDGHDVRRVVSPESPVGQAMLGKVPGDKLSVNTPGGPAEIEVLEVK